MVLLAKIKTGRKRLEAVSLKLDREDILSLHDFGSPKLFVAQTQGIKINNFNTLELVPFQRKYDKCFLS